MNRYELYEELQEAKRRIAELEAIIARPVIRPNPPTSSERRLPPLWKQNCGMPIDEAIIEMAANFKAKTSYDLNEVGIEPDAVKTLEKGFRGRVLYGSSFGINSIEINTPFGAIRVRAAT